MIRVGLLAVTLLLAVSLSVFMWVVNAIPFDPFTAGLHIVSIYIGVAGVLLYQESKSRP